MKRFTTKEELMHAIRHETGANTWDVSRITDMSFLCKDTDFNEDIQGWDVSHVTTMEGMFQDSSFNRPLSWNTSSVTTMKNMFFGAAFNQPLELDTSSVTTMEGMFQYAAFNQPLELNTSLVTTMESMFYRAFFDNTLKLDTSSVTNMKSMFQESAFNHRLKMDTSSVTTMESMFEGSAFNQGLILTDTSSVTNMKSMFQESAFNKPLNMDTSSVTTMESMFQDSAFNQPVLFAESKKVVNMENMFMNTPFNAFLQLNTSSVTTMKQMFRGSAFNQPLPWNTSSVKDMSYLFYEATAFNQPLPWDTSSVTDMSYLFYGATSFNQYLVWDISSVKSMHGIFTHSGMDNVNKKLFHLTKVVDKSITLLIDLHGSILPVELKSTILHTGLSISYGKCLYETYNTATDMLEKIEELKHHYRGKISEGNRSYSFRSNLGTHEQIEKEYNQKNHVGWTREEFHRFNKEEAVAIPRSYLKDTNYSYADDNFSATMGIYILDDRSYLPIQFPIEVDKFRPEIRKTLQVEEYQQLQQRNILNVDVAKQLSSEPLSSEITDEYTQIPHYNNVRLSSVLSFFEHLGYQHVNIIEKSCREEKMPSHPSIRRAYSKDEKDLYEALRKTRGFGGTRKRFIF